MANHTLLEKLKKHHRQLAPHVADRETGQLLRSAIEEIETLQKENAALTQGLSGRPVAQVAVGIGGTTLTITP